MHSLYETTFPNAIENGDFTNIVDEHLHGITLLKEDEKSIYMISNFIKELIQFEAVNDSMISEEYIDIISTYYETYVRKLTLILSNNVFEEYDYSHILSLIEFINANCYQPIQRLYGLCSVVINREVMCKFHNLRRQIPSGLILDMLDLLTHATSLRMHDIVDDILPTIEYYIFDSFEDVSYFVDEGIAIDLMSNLSHTNNSKKNRSILRILDHLLTIRNVSGEHILSLKLVLFDFITDDDVYIRRYSTNILYKLYKDFGNRAIVPICIVLLYINLLKHTEIITICFINELINNRHEYTLKMWKENNMNVFVRYNYKLCFKLLLNNNTHETLKDITYSKCISTNDELPWFLEPEKHNGEIIVCLVN